MGEGDGEHFLGRRHFEVERQAGRLLDALQVAVADVAPVLAQMRGDAVAAARRDDFGGAHRVRVVAAARVPDRGDVVDVDAEAEFVLAAQALRLPGFSTGNRGQLFRQFVRARKSGS